MWRTVPGTHRDPHRVAGKEAPLPEIEHEGEHRVIRESARQGDRLDAGRIGEPLPRDPPTLDREAAEPVVVAGFDDQWDLQVERDHRVDAGDRHVHHRRAVGNHADGEEDRIPGERSTSSGLQCQLPDSRAPRFGRAVEGTAIDRESAASIGAFPSRGAELRRRLTCRAQSRARREEHHVAIERERFRLEAEVRGIGGLHRDRAEEGGNADVDGKGVAPPPTGGEPGEEIGLEGGALVTPVPRRVESHRHSAPRFPGGAEPEQCFAAACGGERERHATPAIDEGVGASDAERRRGGEPGCGGIPEEPRPPTGRTRRDEEDDGCGKEPGRGDGTTTPSEHKRREHRWAFRVHRPRGSDVGRSEERVARPERGTGEEPGEGTRTPRSEALEDPRGVRARALRDRAARQQEPEGEREEHRAPRGPDPDPPFDPPEPRGPGGDSQDRSGDGHAPGQHGRHRPPPERRRQPVEDPRGVGHRPFPTA